MKIFPVSEIAQIDAYTIKNEPIASVDLMERASKAFVEQFQKIYLNEPINQLEVDVFVGPGNNGGDALAVARILSSTIRNVNVWIIVPIEKLNLDSKVNFERLNECANVICHSINSVEEIIKPKPESIVIDGLFGSGLNRPVEGWTKEVIRYINSLTNIVVSIDIPSGLMGEDNTNNDDNAIIRASYTISFQMPKLAFLLPESEEFVGSWHVVDIGLHQDFIEQKKSIYYFTQEEDVKGLLHSRSRFAHKGHFGHALLLAGSYGKMGAAVLSSRACLKSGVGLLTTHLPRTGYSIMQITVPEAMVSIDRSDILISEHPQLSDFSAVGIGPGIGIKPNTKTALFELLSEAGSIPVVLDADAINILSLDSKCLDALPVGSVLTPHPGEFDRLAGKSNNGYERLQKAIAFAKEKKIIIVLKGANTAVINTDGTCYFNSTGNAGMATAGSGDVLTGIVLSFLAQGIPSFEAARLAVYLHGLAGDEYKMAGSMESLNASDIINNLTIAFRRIHGD